MGKGLLRGCAVCVHYRSWTDRRGLYKGWPSDGLDCGVCGINHSPNERSPYNLREERWGMTRATLNTDLPRQLQQSATPRPSFSFSDLITCVAAPGFSGTQSSLSLMDLISFVPGLNYSGANLGTSLTDSGIYDGKIRTSISDFHVSVSRLVYDRTQALGGRDFFRGLRF